MIPWKIIYDVGLVVSISVFTMLFLMLTRMMPKKDRVILVPIGAVFAILAGFWPAMLVVFVLLGIRNFIGLMEDLVKEDP